MTPSGITDQHGSQPRAFHRRGRTCLYPRSAGDLVILPVFAPLECSTCCVVLRQSISPFDAKSKWWQPRISGSIHRSPFDGPRFVDWFRGTNEEDRDRTYKPALDSCPVLIARHREGGGFLHPLSLSLALPRRFRDSWQRVPRAFGSIDSKCAHERVEIFRITTSSSWNGLEGRLLIACIRSNVEESLGKLLEGVILK